MIKHILLITIPVVFMSAQLQARDIKSEWGASKDWVRIDKDLFLELSGWTRRCRSHCYPTSHTRHQEEIGFYINKKSKKIISVEADNNPGMRFLSP